MRSVYLTLCRWGWDPRRTLVAIRGVRRFRRDAGQFRKQQKYLGGADPFPGGPKYPVYGEWNSDGGTASGAYFHQDLFVAREVFRRSPRRHLDVGSRVDGLVAHLASFREVDVIDVRPTTALIPGIHFIHHDMMQATLFPGEQPDSLSCLHALEHFGLGRYGDPINVMGWRDGLLALQKLLAPGGILYLSVPTGQNQRVEFNAHRVFSLPFLRDQLVGLFEIVTLCFVDDSGRFTSDLDAFSPAAARSFDADYGCSIWVLMKRNG